MLDLLESSFRDKSTEYAGDIVRRIESCIGEYPALWHPLGFAIIKLGNSEKYQYRLHLWQRGKRITKKPNWPIHSHVFNLESLVLQGTVGSTRVFINNSPKTRATHQLYCVEYGHSGSNIVRTKSEIEISKSTTSWAAAGETYRIRKGEFHQSVVSLHEHAATLVRTSGVTIGDKPFVVGNLKHDEVYRCPAIGLAKEEYKQVLTPLKSEHSCTRGIRANPGR